MTPTRPIWPNDKLVGLFRVKEEHSGHGVNRDGTPETVTIWPGFVGAVYQVERGARVYVVAPGRNGVDVAITMPWSNLEALTSLEVLALEAP